jgi:hypothetical protein
MAVPLFIIGCCHQAQIDADSTYRHAQRELRQRLTGLIDQHGIRFIGEEAPQRQETTAKKIADSRGLRYLNIDIPLEAQQKIHHQPESRFNDETGEIENLLARDSYAKAWNLVREFHMFRTALVQLETFPEPSILVVGLLHLDPLAALFPSWLIVEKIPMAFSQTPAP